MSPPNRPRAPWYAPATRRLGLLRVGLPTLLVCIFATGPAVAASAPTRAAQDVAVAVMHTAQSATSALDGHGQDGGRHHADEPTGTR